MEEKSIWVENEQLHIKGRSIAFIKINTMFVKVYDTKSKFKRALFMTLAFGFPFFLYHPIYAGIPAFIVISAIGYFTAPAFELRISVYNNDEIGYVESAIHKSNNANHYDQVLFSYDAWQERYE